MKIRNRIFSWSLIGILLVTALCFGAASDYKIDNQGRGHFYDIITKGPWVDVRSFMDGASGRPTYATWYANQATTDVTAVIQAAVNSLGGASGRVLLSNTLKITSSILLPSNIIVEGSGYSINGTYIIANFGSPAFKTASGPASNTNIQLKNMMIDMVSNPTGSIGVDFTDINNSGIENVKVINAVTGTKFATSSGIGYYNRLINPIILNCTTGIFTNSANGLQIFAGNIQPSSVGGHTGTAIDNSSSQVNIFGTNISNCAIGIKTTVQMGIYSPRVENSGSPSGIGIQLLSGSGGTTIFSPTLVNLSTFIDDQSSSNTVNIYGDEGSTEMGVKNYTPTVSSASGVITTYAATGRWIRKGQRVWVSVKANITTMGTASGYMKISLPIPKRNVAGSPSAVLAMQETFISGKTSTGLIGQVDLNNILVYFYDGTTPFLSDGVIWEGSGWYEVNPL